MKHSATTLDPAAKSHEARASWPLPEPTLAYFPDVRFANSDRDLGAGATRPSRGGITVADAFGHVPVLLDRCVELLTPALTRREPDGSGAVLVDATLGAGGHAERFLTDLPGLRVIGLDRDPNALWIAGERLAGFGDRVLLTRTRFDGIQRAVAESGYWSGESGESKIDAVLFDLGVSS